MIFPLRGEDNRVYAGKLIDLPSSRQAPFKADPKPDQVGEMLTIIVTASPLSSSLSTSSLPISNDLLTQWESMWSGVTERFELNNGAGQVRTLIEQQATSRSGMRQLTR